MKQKDVPGKKNFKGTIVRVNLGKDGDEKALLDACTDVMFLLFAYKSPPLLPRIRAALVLACKCQMYVRLHIPLFVPRFLFAGRPLTL